MNILTIDTSTEACSVALTVGNETIDRFQLAPMQHAKLILSMIDEVLSEASITVNQLDAIAFSAGPGSFTGVRIAASVTQGLAYAHDIPVIPVSTLATLAQGAHLKFSAEYILTALDARMNQVYWGAYQVNDGLVHTISNDCVINPSEVEIPPSQNQWIGVGLGWSVYSESFNPLFKNILSAIYPQNYPQAKNICPLAQDQYNRGQLFSAENALPIYLREKVV